MVPYLHSPLTHVPSHLRSTFTLWYTGRQADPLLLSNPLLSVFMQCGQWHCAYVNATGYLNVRKYDIKAWKSHLNANVMCLRQSNKEFTKHTLFDTATWNPYTVTNTTMDPYCILVHLYVAVAYNGCFANILISSYHGYIRVFYAIRSKSGSSISYIKVYVCCDQVKLLVCLINSNFLLW